MFQQESVERSLRDHRRVLALSREDLLLVVGYSVLAVALVAWQGQDLNWDLLNYHFYNPYMLVNGRIGRDVHAPGMQAFLNPLVDLPFYAAVRLDVPPRLFFSLLAAFHGLMLFFVHRIAAAAVPHRSAWQALCVGLIAAITAAFGPGFRTEIGNTMHDSTLSVLVLASLWLLVAQVDDRADPSRRAILIAGFLGGAAGGLKMAFAPLCIGLSACAFVIPGTLRTRTMHVALFLAAVGLGVMATAGYWMWLMYHHFDSPLFPFFNTIFRSSFAPARDFADAIYLPRTATQAIFYPFYWIPTQGLVTGPHFHDARFAVILVSLSVLAVQRMWILVTRAATTGPFTNRLLLIVVFWLVSYVIWLRMFSVYRYAIALEVLAGVFVIAVTANLTRQWKRSLAVAVPVCLALCLYVQVPDYGRTNWSDSYFGVDAQALRKFDRSVILMWDFPQAYLVPYFPNSTTFIRILSNWGLDEETTMWRRAVRTIRAADDRRLYLLDGPIAGGPELQATMLGRLGLEQIPDSCEVFPSHHASFRLCALRRRPRIVTDLRELRTSRLFADR